MALPCGEAYIEMCEWYLWLHDYMHDIENSLHDGGKSHVRNHHVWVVSMIVEAAQSIGMVMYLLARGVVLKRRRYAVHSNISEWPVI
jgi:hypothetical protein